MVLERNRADDTFGWGVVFSDQTLGNIAAADPPTYERIVASFVHWDDIDVHYRGRTIRAGGQGFAGHRAQEAAAHPPRARAGARRRPALRGRGERRGLRGRRRHRDRRRRQLADAPQVRRRVRHDAREPQEPLHLAGHAPALRRVHVRVRGDAARLVPGARLPVRRGHRHRDRGVPRGDVARGRARHARRPRSRSRSASGCSRRTSAATG